MKIYETEKDFFTSIKKALKTKPLIIRQTKGLIIKKQLNS